MHPIFIAVAPYYMSLLIGFSFVPSLLIMFYASTRRGRFWEIFVLAVFALALLVAQYFYFIGVYDFPLVVDYPEITTTDVFMGSFGLGYIIWAARLLLDAFKHPYAHKSDA